MFHGAVRHVIMTPPTAYVSKTKVRDQREWRPGQLTPRAGREGDLELLVKIKDTDACFDASLSSSKPLCSAPVLVMFPVPVHPTTNHN